MTLAGVSGCRKFFRKPPINGMNFGNAVTTDSYLSQLLFQLFLHEQISQSFSCEIIAMTGWIDQSALQKTETDG